MHTFQIYNAKMSNKLVHEGSPALPLVRNNPETLMVCCRLGDFGSLPAELWEPIIGFLDLRTLCTARLVSTFFRDEGARFLRSVKLGAEDLRRRPDLTLDQFPKLRRVALYGVEKDFPLIAQSPFCKAVTHFITAVGPSQMPTGAPLPPLPNLMSLTVYLGAANPALDYSTLFPATLEELLLEGSSRSSMSAALKTLTKLTSLRAPVMFSTHDRFSTLLALTSLQRLEIEGDESLFNFVTELTLLTYLRLKRIGVEGDWDRNLDLGPFTRLQKLVHLGVTLYTLVPHQLAAIARIPCLKSLELEALILRPWAALEAAALVPFARLTSLDLMCGYFDLSVLSKVNMEGLMALTLNGEMGAFGSEGLAFFGRATGLTHLKLWDRTTNVPNKPVELGQALSRMSSLEALSLRAAWSSTTSCFEAIRLLTSLTKLEWEGEYVTNADVRACLCLNKLRVLIIRPDGPAPSDGTTPETVFAVSKLPELRRVILAGASHSDFFSVIDEKLGFRLTDEGKAVINGERLARGWPVFRLALLRTDNP